MKLLPACGSASLASAAIVFLPVAVASFLDSPTDPPTVSELLGLASTVTLYALLVRFLFGVPIHWALRRVGWHSLWQYVLVGALLALAVARLFFDPAEGLRWFLGSATLLALAGSIGAFIFWRNHVRGA